MIELILPDGAVRQVSPGINGAQIAEQISPSLAKRAAAMVLDGEIVDLSEQITKNASCEIITRDDPRALELIRHDAAHVMAEAVQELWPGTQVTIGPAIENGFYYDFARSEPFTPDDLPKIETRMREIIARNAPFTKEVWTRDQAKSYFAARGEHYKGELIDAIGEDEPIKIYRQGSWLDLCRGPHMVSTGQIGSAFKLTRLAGAYWRGDAKNAMLTRIYGIAFATDKQLKSHLNMLAEAEKRDHRRLGRELDLFHFQEDGPGVVFWHPKGWTMFQSLINHMRRRLAITGYQEVNAPQILDRSMWETSGHWDWYRENMFVTQTEDERVFAIKPMNCPGHVQIFKHGLKSYRDLPIRYAEFGAVSRYEPSGALHGLMRVRAFTQDDAHVFCTEAQLAEECLAINDLILATYGDFGFENIRVVLSTRPDERVGDDASWDHAEAVMRKLLVDIEERSGGRISVGINPGDGAFYGPKFDYYLRDAIGREWQCGTTQLDFNLPARFESFYIDHDGEKKVPIMIHRAICGSMERFLGILIENFAGNFPLWFAPLQCVVTTITNEADDYASQFCDRLRDAGIRAELDLRNEKINYKVREHSLQKVPIIAVCGAREAEEGTVSLRRLGSKGQTLLPIEEAIALIEREAALPALS